MALRVVLSVSLQVESLQLPCLRVSKSLSHFLGLVQDLNEYAVRVLIVNTRYPTSVALTYLAVKGVKVKTIFMKSSHDDR